MQLHMDRTRGAGNRKTGLVARLEKPLSITRRDLLLAGAAGTASALGLLPKVAFADAQWQMSTPLPKAMEEIVGVAVGKSMYVFGGYERPGAAYRFDEDGGRWTTLHHMPERAHHLMATQHAGQIYIFGGFTFGSNNAWNRRERLTAIIRGTTAGQRWHLCRACGAPAKP